MRTRLTVAFRRLVSAGRIRPDVWLAWGRSGSPLARLFCFYFFTMKGNFLRLFSLMAFTDWLTYKRLFVHVLF